MTPQDQIPQCLLINWLIWLFVKFKVINDQSLHRVSAKSMHYYWRYEHFVASSRNLWTTQVLPRNNNNYSEYRAHCTLKDRPEPSVLTQKSVLKNIHRVLRYWQKCTWVVQRFLLQATKSDHEKELAIRKMFISSKVMYQYRWNLV